jgi:hypothetical protein
MVIRKSPEMAFINYLERIFLYTTLKCIPEPLEMVLLNKPEMEFMNNS